MICSTPGFPVLHHLLELTHMSAESVMPSNHLILCCPLLFCSCQLFPEQGSFLVNWLFRKGGGQRSFSFSISSSNEYSGLTSFRIDWFDLLVVQGTLKESSSAQFKSISSSVIRLLYGPTLISVHDYWKNHSFDYTDLCQQSDVSAFEYAVQVCHSFPSKEQASFNFMAAVTICSDFEAQESKICHCFHFFPFLLSWYQLSNIKYCIE